MLPSTTNKRFLEVEIYNNRLELVDVIAKEAGLSKVESEKALKAFINIVSKEHKKVRFSL